MSLSASNGDLSIGRGIEYRIVVERLLDESYAERLAGMRITRTGTPDGPPMTLLVGRLRDQAELLGVLNNLYEMHIPILEMRSAGLGSDDPE